MKTNNELIINVDEQGGLVMKNAKTIKRYNDLKEEMRTHNFDGIFFAFSEKQFDEGLNSIKHLMKDGEKVVSFCSGGYGLREYVQKMNDYYDKMNNIIAEECDPQEVYCYEYNNHECMYGYNGDSEAMDCVYGIFGEEGLRAIKYRRGAYMTVEQIILTFAKPFELDKELTMNGEKPHHVWFDDKGLAFCMSACVLYEVMQGDKQFKTTNETWFGMTAHYDISKKTGKPILYKFHKD